MRVMLVLILAAMMKLDGQQNWGAYHALYIFVVPAWLCLNERGVLNFALCSWKCVVPWLMSISKTVIDLFRWSMFQIHSLLYFHLVQFQGVELFVTEPHLGGAPGLT